MKCSLKTAFARLAFGGLLGTEACLATHHDPDAGQEFTANLQYSVTATPQVTALPGGRSGGPQVVALPGDEVPTVVRPGDALNFAVGWQGGAIANVNMSFTSNQYFFIPVPNASTATEGVVQIPAILASSVCDPLDDGCYAIQCFEQVATANGGVSVAVARQFILDCGGTGCGETGTGTAQPGDPCGTTTECIPGSVCFNRFCVGAGMLRVSLAFSVDSDFDLHVVTPSGAEIRYSDRTADGGTLDVDQCISTCGTDPHAENVVFDGSALAGQYEVWVVNFSARAAGDFSIQVAGDASQTFTGSLPAEDMAESEHFTFEL
jgi:hypothetical protein